MPSSPVSRAYLLQESLLFLLFAFLLFFANTWRAYSDYNLIRLGVGAMTLASATWLALGLRRKVSNPTPLSVPLALFLAALTSIDPRRSLDEVWVAAMYVFGFALTAQLAARGWPRELFVKTLLLAGSLLMGVSWLLALSWYRGWLAAAPGQWIPDIAYRLPLANGQATFLNLLTLSAIARLIDSRARAPRIFLSLWILSALGLLFLTASRGGWLGFAAGLAAIAVVKLKESGGATFFRSQWQRAKGRWQISLPIALIGFVALVALGRIASRQILNPQKATASQARVEFWVPAWKAFLQRPLTGQGPLTFGSAYLRYNSVPPYGFFAHAHSIFFNLLAETGVVGVIAFGVLAAATFVALWRQVHRLTGNDRAVALSALAASICWAAHSLVDSVNVEPMNSLLMTVLLGAGLAGRGADTRTTARFRAAPPLALAQTYFPISLGLILSATGLYNVWRLAPLHDGVVSATRSQWAEAASHFEEAARRDPGSAIAHQQWGLAESIRANEGDTAALDRAIAVFETTARLDPDWWLNHANLAALYFARGDSARALNEFRAAAALGSGSPLLQLNYGVAAEAANEWNEAREAYVRTLALRRDWADAYFWRATPFRADVLRQWWANAPALPVPPLTQLEAKANGGDRARDYMPLIATYLQMGRATDAEVLLKKVELAYFDTGEDRLEVSWLWAEASAARGDFESAASLGEAAVDGYFAQSVFGPGSFGAAAYG
ncbi:MAG: hypothetical protein FJ030_00880 [Chloroflexi bacterium]|nr:hypothetical protein [Chloroflexota bacterium]